MNLFDSAVNASNQSDWTKAAACYRAFLVNHPNHEWASNNLGYCLWQLGNPADAIPLFKKALSVNSENSMAYANLIGCLEQTDQKTATIAYRRQLVRLNPDNADHYTGLANSLVACGRVHEAISWFQESLKLRPDSRNTICDYLLALNYSDQHSVDHIAEQHFFWSAAWQASQRQVESPDSTAPKKRLRIGYISSDFCQHPVGKMLEHILRSHDHASFKIFLYSDRSDEDDWTRRIREYGEFAVTTQMSDDELTARIRSDGIDVLVETAGYTGGRNRLSVFANRAAAAQISFLGYPNTTGHSAVDFRLTDEYCDPEGKTEKLHSEQLIRLNHGFLAFPPVAHAPPADESPAIRNGFITWGSFNNPSKLSVQLIEAWSRILTANSEFRLCLKYGSKYQDPGLTERYIDQFCSRGVHARQLQFLPVEPTYEGHLRTIASVDIALDSFPYQGTFTTLETLNMGVPLVTLIGDNYCQRASSAMLLRLGLTELVTTKVDDYVEKALELAKKTGNLSTIRNAIRQKFRNSTLCDPMGLARELESVYRTAWEQRFNRIHTPRAPGRIKNKESNCPLLPVQLCTGIPRSGSTWSYNVTRLMLEKTYHDKQVVAAYREGNETEKFLKNLSQNSAFNCTYLLKLHYAGSIASKYVSEGSIKNICTIRDPMDAVASFRDIFDEPVEKCASQVRRAFDIAERWLGSSCTLFLSYEEIITRPRTMIDKIADYLGINCSTRTLDEIDKSTDVTAVRQFLEELDDSESSLPAANRSLPDPVPQYHKRHSINPYDRNGRLEFSDAERMIVEEKLGRWVEDWRVFLRS